MVNCGSDGGGGGGGIAICCLMCCDSGDSSGLDMLHVCPRSVFWSKFLFGWLSKTQEHQNQANPSTRIHGGTESWALRRSTKTIYPLDWCSLNFSMLWSKVKIWSVQERPRLKPHCVSGSSSSATTCNPFWRRRPSALPTTSNKAIPRQLSHDDRSPRLGIVTNSAFRQACGGIVSMLIFVHCQ